MTRLLHRIALALSLWLCSTPLFAASNVQIVLQGGISEDGGWRVEFQCEAGQRQVAVRTQFAGGTSAADVAAFLARRLKAAGIGYTLGDNTGTEQRISLIIEGVERIEARFGGSLRARLMCMDEAPTALTVRTPRSSRDFGRGRLKINVTLEEPETAQWQNVEVRAELHSSSTSDRVAIELRDMARREGLKAEAHETDGSWRLLGGSSDGVPVAMEIELDAYADWGVELVLRPAVQQR